MEQEFSIAVDAAARRPQVCRAVENLYLAVQAAIELRRPQCQVSGRCCQFDTYGHRLYVTTMELAAFVAAGGLIPAGSSSQSTGCPFQVDRLCGVHAIRPFGCRIFFCDKTSTQWQQEQYEQFHHELKRLHQELQVPYFYKEWRAALAAVKEH